MLPTTNISIDRLVTISVEWHKKYIGKAGNTGRNPKSLKVLKKEDFKKLEGFGLFFKTWVEHF